MLKERLLGGRRTASFTLQWHLTNACGLACTHCYDRSKRAILRGDAAVAVLDDLAAFARRHGVRPQVSFTGGDPFLHPDFWSLYREATRRQVRASILGNPVAATVLDELVRLQDPAYYQVSLEGLEATNDAVRGAGHFQRTLAFLEAAKARHVTTHVMLTLTRDNANEVLPLARRLEGLVRKVSFNRLAREGNGSALAHPPPEQLEALLEAWSAAAETSRALGRKDNLLNPVRARAGQAPFPGCTGHGCGAAFNFVALLPDGEVHSCRKFPSLLGRLPGTTFEALWRSTEARRYRAGAAGCDGCALKPTCGGCLAVTHGEGLDPLVARDPQCPTGPLTARELRERRAG